MFADAINESKVRLNKLNRKPKANPTDLKALYKDNILNEKEIPAELNIKPGDVTTLRGVLGSSLGYINKNQEAQF